MDKIPNKKAIVDYYETHVNEFGFGAKGMDWKNIETQYLRFEIINRYVNFESKSSLLDVGCGSAAYLDYCKDNNLIIDYKGIDITASMVKEVNRKFGENTAELISIDEIQDHYDYVIASGTFNAKLNEEVSKWETYVYNSLQNMFRVARKRVIVNLMTPCVDYEYDRLFYPSLDKLSSFLSKELTRNFIIDHSYELYEMTLCIEK